MVSIHAPTWGATAAADTLTSDTTVSIHAPTWGATLDNDGDRFMPEVSIHAPTWGATKLPSVTGSIRVFQSTRPRGARHGLRYRLPQKLEFQSTRPRGARHMMAPCRLWTPCFNPRAHVGRDKYIDKPHKSSDVSIHAPTWGATLAIALSASSRVFQSTRPRGARRCLQIRALHVSSFNPRAHVGRDCQC